MKMKRYILVLLAFIVAAPLAITQEKAKTDFAEDFIKVWKRHKIYTLRLIEAMPEANFDYKPAEEARTFGAMALHVTGANYMFSSISSGNEFPIDREMLKAEGKSKGEIIQMLTESFDYSLKALMAVDEDMLKQTTPWGNPIEQSTIRSFKEVFHVMREHAAHHRGAMTVYLRLNGVTPPGFID